MPDPQARWWLLDERVAAATPVCEGGVKAWGFDPASADWDALALLGYSPRTTWPGHRGWWMPTTYFQEAPRHAAPLRP